MNKNKQKNNFTLTVVVWCLELLLEGICTSSEWYTGCLGLAWASWHESTLRWWVQKYHVLPPAPKLPEVKELGSYAYTTQPVDDLEPDTPDSKLSMYTQVIWVDDFTLCGEACVYLS